MMMRVYESVNQQVPRLANHRGCGELFLEFSNSTALCDAGALHGKRTVFDDTARGLGS